MHMHADDCVLYFLQKAWQHIIQSITAGLCNFYIFVASAIRILVSEVAAGKNHARILNQLKRSRQWYR